MIRTDAAALHVEPEGELTVYQVETLLKQLRAALDEAPAVVVDLSRTDKIDTAGFQLLVALQKSCRVLGKAFELTGVCGAVQDFMTLYGYKSMEEKEAEDGH